MTELNSIPCRELEYKEVGICSVHVSGSCTSYASMVRHNIVIVDDLKETLKNIRRMVRGKGISVLNQKKFMTKIVALEEDAIEEYSHYTELFDKYIAFWKDQDLSNGLTQDTFDKLDQSYELRNEIYKLHYTTTKLSQYISRSSRLKDIESRLSFNISNYSNGSKFYL